MNHPEHKRITMQKTIPNLPGCYLFKDDKGIVLYVGKAKMLSHRVKSYFQKNIEHEKTKNMLERAAMLDYIVTNNEVEALILENNLIKKHSPKYNIDLKDSKRYAYLEVTNEQFPRLVLARKQAAGGNYYGSFVSGTGRNEIMDLLIKTFKIRTCTKLPKRSCLRYHIGLCSAPCINNISKKDYQQGIDHAAMVLSGKTKELLNDLQKEMERSSQELAYERALVLKKQINALAWLDEKQAMERKKTLEEDIIAYRVQGGTVYLLVFSINQGMLENKKDFEFPAVDSFFEEFLTQYYSDERVPKELILPHEIDMSLIEYLSSLRGRKVMITIPQRGDKKNLLLLAEKNIDISFFSEQKKLEDLRDALSLNQLPEVIECFDVSHLSGSMTVASMVQFRGGKPDKSNYRCYKIKTVEGIDDFASIAEVVFRRYSRLLAEHTAMPDLVVIDGGAGQLHAALHSLSGLGISIPIISLAKRFEEIYLPGEEQPIILDKKRGALLLLQAVRDEAHRFAISYNKLLRKKQVRA